MQYIVKYLSTVIDVVNRLPKDDINKMVKELVDLKQRSGRLFIIGVGEALPTHPTRLTISERLQALKPIRQQTTYQNLPRLQTTTGGNIPLLTGLLVRGWMRKIASWCSLSAAVLKRHRRTLCGRLFTHRRSIPIYLVLSAGMGDLQRSTRMSAL